MGAVFLAGSGKHLRCAGSRRDRGRAGSNPPTLGEDELYNAGARVCLASGNGTPASIEQATSRR
jgi:hypothetical protein